MISKFFVSLINLLFPSNCKVCDEELNFIKEKYICTRCISKTIFISRPFCIKCGKQLLKIFKNEQIECKDCKNNRKYFYMARTMAIYTGAIKQAILLLKYQKKQIMANLLSNLMINYLLTNLPEYRYQTDVILPVPLHKKRYNQRGFNQAELIAKKLSKPLNKKIYTNVLIKTKETLPQVGLSLKQRRTNLIGAFSINKNKKNIIERKNILLIDDVYTTGSTVNECSKVLLKEGAKRIYVYTIARGA